MPTCTFDPHESPVEIEVQADKATVFSFSSEDKPKNILLDNTVLRGWQYNAATKMVSVKLTEGKHDLSIN